MVYVSILFYRVVMGFYFIFVCSLFAVLAQCLVYVNMYKPRRVHLFVHT